MLYFITFSSNSFQDKFTPDLTLSHLLCQDCNSALGIHALPNQLVPTRWSPSLVTTLIPVSSSSRAAVPSKNSSVLILFMIVKVITGFSYIHSSLTHTLSPDHGTALVIMQKNVARLYLKNISADNLSSCKLFIWILKIFYCHKEVNYPSFGNWGKTCSQQFHIQVVSAWAVYISTQKINFSVRFSSMCWKNVKESTWLWRQPLCYVCWWIIINISLVLLFLHLVCLHPWTHLLWLPVCQPCPWDTHHSHISCVSMDHLKAGNFWTWCRIHQLLPFDIKCGDNLSIHLDCLFGFQKLCLTCHQHHFWCIFLCWINILSHTGFHAEPKWEFTMDFLPDSSHYYIGHSCFC